MFHAEIESIRSQARDFFLAGKFDQAIMKAKEMPRVFLREGVYADFATDLASQGKFSESARFLDLMLERNFQYYMAVGEVSVCLARTGKLETAYKLASLIDEKCPFNTLDRTLCRIRRYHQ